MRAIRTEFIILFLMAGGIALVAVPLKTLFWLPDHFSIFSVIPVPERSLWHGHALLAGYSQVVLGGYLLTRPGKHIILSFAVLWLGARLSIFIPGPTGLYLGAATNIAVFGLLFIYAGLTFFRAAKRLKSAIPGMVILLLFLSEAVFQTGEIMSQLVVKETALRSVIWLLIILLFMMGGRIIAAATSGALQKRNMYMPYMAQGRLETCGVIALISAALSDLVSLPMTVTTIFSILAAAVIFRRLWNWRVWLVRDAFDLTSLHLGYAMLAIGLVFNAALTYSRSESSLAGFHGTMIGGFALLSITIMCRTVLQRLRFALVLPVIMRIACVCIFGTAVTRMAAFQNFAATEFLVASSLLWVMAFSLFVGTLFGIIWRFHKQP